MMTDKAARKPWRKSSSEISEPLSASFSALVFSEDEFESSFESRSTSGSSSDLTLTMNKKERMKKQESTLNLIFTSLSLKLL